MGYRVIFRRENTNRCKTCSKEMHEYRITRNRGKILSVLSGR
jgi:hypothetical protein